METNVELEFINKVLELGKKMQDLAIFWLKNEKELEELNVCESYPFSLHLRDLALDTRNWLVTLINDYNESLQK